MSVWSNDNSYLKDRNLKVGFMGIVDGKGNMERFTEKFKDGRNIIRKGITDVFYVGFGRFFYGEAVDRIAEYEDLEEQGKLLKLPCAVGDTVYEVQEIRKRIQQYEITAAHVDRFGKWYFYWRLKDGQGIYGRVAGFSESYLGVKVFFTREEAEAALKEL